MELNSIGLDRIATFVNWYQDRSALPIANAGFVYSGERDRVSCPVCSVEIENWALIDDPVLEHIKRSPYCSLANKCHQFSEEHMLSHMETLVRGLRESVEPYLKGSNPRCIIRSAEQANHLKSLFESALKRNKDRANQNLKCFEIEGDCFGASSLGAEVVIPPPPGPVDRQTPDYERLKSERIRLSTYHDWPSANKAIPSKLSKAGFFYTGSGDRVCCVFCRGILKNWVPEDQPMEEHKKHFPNCLFVGNLNVGNIELKNDEMILASSSIPRSPFQAECILVEPTNLASVMKSTCVQTVLKMGFSHDVVQTIVEKKLNEGTRFSDSETLIETLLQETRNPGMEKSTAIFNSQEPVASIPTKLITAENAGNENAENETSVTEEEMLLEENNRLKEARTCKVCMDKEVNTVFLPCGHLICCNECAPQVRNCPLCRTYIRGTVKTFLP